jgi:outer membrane protein TolC
MSRLATLLALVPLVPAFLVAQAPNQPVTLSGAIGMALANHPGSRAARAGATAASEEVAVARTAYWPRLDALWQTNHATRNNVFGLLLPQFVVPPVSGPVLAEESLSGVWSSAGGLLMSWEPIDFGRRSADVTRARAEAEAADAQRRLTDLQVSSAAADAFLLVMATEAVAAASRANIQRLETFATAVRALVESQLRAGSDLSRADAELAAALNVAAEAERDAEVARLTLAEALGAPGSAIAVAPGNLLTAPPGQPEPEPQTPAAHPSLVAAQADIEAARARDLALERAGFPRVELQAAASGRGVSQNIDGTDAGTGLALDVPNWALGVTVSFPAIDVFRNQTRRRAEAARLDGATARHERAVQALQSDAARARAVTTAARKIAANAPRQLQAARDARTQAAARYDAGLGSVVEVAEAERLLADAEAQAAVAMLAVWRARLAQAVVEGDLTSFVRQAEATVPPGNP